MEMNTGRRLNNELRSRRFLTPGEVDLLMGAVKRKNRYGHRDATMILLTYQHGLRAGEVRVVRWQQFDLEQGTFYVNRLKNGVPNVHPLSPREVLALTKLKREQPANRFLFVSERGCPMTRDGFLKMVKKAGNTARFPFAVHPHMLRHGCGYNMAREGNDVRTIQRFMGHRQIENTVMYTTLDKSVFKDFWAE